MSIERSDLDLFNACYNNKKVLITGDTGFKGSWLSIWLKELGADVYGYSLPPKNSSDNYVKTGLANHINHIDGDVRDVEKLTEVFKQIKPDIAFHLAAQSLVLESYSNPRYNFETNLMGTVNFFEAVRSSESLKVAVNITSDKCYRNTEMEKGYIESDPMGGDDPYSASKGAAELITNSYIKSFFSSENSVNVASARAGNVIGAGDWAQNRILPDLIRAYYDKKSILIRNPDSVRPWQYVLEPLFGYLKLGERLLDGKEKYVGAWNFGPVSYEKHSVRDVVNEVISLLPTLKVEEDKRFNKPHEAGLLLLDISKSTSNLDWQPKLNFKQAVNFTIDGYLAEENCTEDMLYKSRVEQIKLYCKL